MEKSCWRVVSQSATVRWTQHRIECVNDEKRFDIERDLYGDQKIKGQSDSMCPDGRGN